MSAVKTLEDILSSAEFEIQNDTGIPLEILIEGNLITIKQC